LKITPIQSNSIASISPRNGEFASKGLRQIASDENGEGDLKLPFHPAGIVARQNDSEKTAAVGPEFPEKTHREERRGQNKMAGLSGPSCFIL
jgi:hypothetical protein